MEVAAAHMASHHLVDEGHAVHSGRIVSNQCERVRASRGRGEGIRRIKQESRILVIGIDSELRAESGGGTGLMVPKSLPSTWTSIVSKEPGRVCC